MCCTQAKLAFPTGGRPYFQRTIFFYTLAAPIAHIERRIGEDEIGFEILVEIIVKSVRVLRAKIGFDPTNGKVHLREFPRGRIRFLTVGGNIPDAATVLSDKLITLHEHTA